MPVKYNIGYNSVVVLFIYVVVCRVMLHTISIHCMVLIMMKISLRDYCCRTLVLGQLSMLQNGQGISLLDWRNVSFWYLSYPVFLVEGT